MRFRILVRCNRPVDGASLAVFRLLFGLVMAWAMVRLLVNDWVRELYLAPAFHFTWEWFPWMRVLPGNGMYWLTGALALLALGMGMGRWRRVCAGLFCLGFTYLELIDQTNYLNHYYLASLLSGLLAILPDREQVPEWTVWLLRFQVGVVYGFAGLAKLNADWLLAAQPMRIWLAARSDLPWVGPGLAKSELAFAASWCGAIYDLTIPCWLLWARSRPWAYAAVVIFHLATLVLFRIGMFPWLMLAATLIFFPPDWPRRWVSKFWWKGSTGREGNLGAWALVLLMGYAGLQLALPLRAFLYPQQGAWDGRGFNFAWRVMLAEKTGHVEFYAFDPVTRARRRLAVAHLVTPRQRLLMAQDPALIRQMAVRLAQDFPAAERAGWEVRVEARATLNGRPSQYLIRPEVNLAGPLPPDWIVPLNTE